MNRKEFVEMAVRCGYARKDVTEKWCEKQGREEFTEQDFEEVYYAQQSKREWWHELATPQHGRHRCDGGRTTRFDHGLRGHFE